MSRVLKLSQQKERAVRGKYAEDKVREQLKLESERRAGFDFERNYDARSAGGHIPKRAGDFTFYESYVFASSAGGATEVSHGLVEVKQLAHPYRLPRKNFEPDKKFGVLRKREMAGGRIVIVVLHTRTMKWRLVPFHFFMERREQPSWDLSQFQQFDDAKSVLKAAGVVG